MTMKSMIAVIGLASAASAVSAPAFGQDNTPEWRNFSQSDLQAVSTRDLTGRVLAKHTIEHVHRAAEQGDAEAAWVLSYAYKQGMGGLERAPDEAYRWSRISCDLGSQRGCNALAFNLDGGTGTAKDQAEAMSLFQSTCAQGTYSSCSAIAAAYYNGDSVLPQDYAMALDFRMKGCNLGRASSCRIAGDMTYAGEGSEKDTLEAHKLYARGC